MTFFYAKNLRRTTKGSWVRPLIAPLDVDGVGIDSRADLTGKAFIAIHGEHHDGHDYLAEAIHAGAQLLIVDREPSQETLPPDTAVLRVDDTRTALARLAAAYRRTLINTTVIAITGSAGKTTTKQLIDSVLSTTLRGTAAPKSFNNDIGLPLTILNAHVDDAYLIVEIGANRLGEVNTLSAIARPDIAVITNVGRAHLEGFGTVENVAKEKAALLDHLQPNGLGIINADAPQLRNYRGRAQSIVWFGLAQDADLRLTDRGACDETWWFEVNEKDRFGLGLPGAHNAVNALAAVAVGRRLGLSDKQIDQGLAQCEPVAMRMTCHKLGGMTIYNDAYNANPDSMIAALDTFAELTIEADRRVVILGDMLELGAQAEALHVEIGRSVIDLDRRAPIAHAVLIGSLSCATARVLTQAWGADRVTHMDELNEQTAAFAARHVQPGDRVLLKGSRSMGLERMLDALAGAPTVTQSVVAATP